jgi:uncharacterized protein YdhG (YjbR/CyaY superfamily)
MPTPATVEEYLAGLSPERRERIEAIRRTVAAAAPMATESIAYQMPAFRSHGGQFLVSFAAWKKHDSLFPASDAVVAALGADLVPHLAGKGTIRFPADRPIPVELVARIVAVRVAENAAAERL